MEEEEEDEKLNISTENVSLDNLDISIIDQPDDKLKNDILLEDIEILA
jgi:hypothetical protein